MLKATYAKQFDRDLKQMAKRGKDLEKIEAVIRLICDERPLPERHKDHALKGEWRGFRDCHIEPDWILIYTVEQDEARFTRTGSHSDIFR